jgi:hypothetical protein
VVAGGAWTFSTPSAATVRSTIRRLREVLYPPRQLIPMLIVDCGTVVDVRVVGEGNVESSCRYNHIITNITSERYTSESVSSSTSSCPSSARSFSSSAS